MLSIPTGYFIYDFFDMVVNQKLSQSWELIFHHLVVGLSSITVTVRKKAYILDVILWPTMFHLDCIVTVEPLHLGKKSFTCTNHPY